MGDSLDRHSDHLTSELQARVRGAGPTGALAALALAEAGWLVELEDPLTASQLLARNRAYALTHSSRRLLERLQLWEELAPALAPFRALELHDLELGLQVPFTARDLGRRAASPSTAVASTGSASSGDDAVGWVVRHTPLMELLLRRLEGDGRVQLALGSPGSQTPVDLLVAAEGAASSTRQGLGLAHWRLPYSQSCLSVQVRLRGSASDQAWELFRAEGPFAVLPLGGDRFQLVWSGPAQRMRRLESLDPVAFLDRLAGALPDGLQADALLDAPRAFPAALELSGGFHRGNTVLVGETMHRCHPVGGQGLNLCWRDVAVLHKLAARTARGRLRLSRLPAAYGRRRWPDVLLTLLATDALVRLFSNRQWPQRSVRQLGLGLLGRLPLLRRLSLRTMTLGPCQLLARWSE